MSLAQLALSDNLPDLVKRKYEFAEVKNGLLFSATQLAVIHAAKIPFQLRFCPTLNKKDGQTGTKTKNPFEDPDDLLLVAKIPSNQPTHSLVLNKYPIIPQHFILATQTFKEQTHLLEDDDLHMVYACLKAWEHDGQTSSHRRLFAFFNSGLHSGASQRHRHVQFLPIEQMLDGQDSQQAAWIPLIDLMDEGPSEVTAQLPFAHFHAKIPPDPIPSCLHEIYLSLYDKAKASVHAASLLQSNQGFLDHFAAEISYNLAITTSTMAICPRTSEGSTLSRETIGKNEQSCQGSIVALNGTLLSGTLMVKNENDWNELRCDEGKLYNLLKLIGVPPNHSEHSTKTTL